ncbi:MAG: TIGR04290 family methyltransferase [Desulfobacterales bacterium]
MFEPVAGHPAESALKEEIATLAPWFHNLHLPDGTQTAPDHRLGDFPAFKWAEIERHIPRDLTGWSVLDIGCNAGFYSFKLASRGAEVLGIDANPHYLRQARWASDKLDPDGRIQFEKMQVYELAGRRDAFDLVLFLGVFYHLRYPLLALDIVSRKVKRLLVFQSLTLQGDDVDPARADYDLDDRDELLQPGWPKMSFIENRFARDPTNWWVPNHACIKALLRASGFTVFNRPGKEIYISRPAPPPGPYEALWIEEYMAVVGERAV